MNGTKNLKKKSGFTLAEMLITVMIIVILFALAVPAVFTIQRNLRQKELDQKAQTIYTAVQNRLSELYATGNSSLYDPGTHDDIIMIGDFPGDYDDTIDTNKLTKDSVYYITSDSDIAKELFGDGVFDESLYNKHWVIEIIPYTIDETDMSKSLTAATVYAVYYSEDVISVNEEYATGGTINDAYLNTYRFKNKRLASVAKGGTDARVGYYGGSSLGSSSGTSSLSITDIQIYSNEEVETAVVKARKPGSVTAKAEFTFKLSDAYGHTYTITYDDESKRFVADGTDITNNKTINVSRVGVNYTFTFTLDDLSSENTRFNKLYGENSGHGEKSLVSGSDIKLEATITSDDQTASSDTKYALGNSLFAYTDEGAKDVTKKDYAEIQCARHLQNLDSSSVVTSDITTATLLNDISFKEDSDFYEEYSSGYFNGTIKTNKINTNGSISNLTTTNFKGIQNDSLTTFNGANYSIFNLTTSSGGLFDSVKNNLVISDLTLVGEKINSNSSVGSLIGTVTSTASVSITNSSSYISSANNDIPSVITSDMNLESFRFLQGSTVGGLVGTNNGVLTIEDSFASSVLGKESSTTAGLVGSNTGTLSITKAYSDSYLYGSNVAGLVGLNSKTVNITSAYAAGFIGLDQKEDAISAGLVLGQATSMKDVYTIIACYNVDADQGMKKNSDDPFMGKYYSTCINGINSLNKVYYLRDSTDAGDNIENTIAITDAKNMSFSSTSGFVIDTSLSTNPYRLMGQSLTSYTYPRFSDLDHYGDWDVSFVSGALVYYEQYRKDNTTYYGFDGAGVDISLTGNDTIIGDGYGIVVKESQSSIPTTFTVKISDGTTKTINTSTDAYFNVVKNNETYRIYPLSKEEINVDHAIEGYYERVSISSSNSETKYFDFNPHFARSVVDVDSENSPTSAIPSEISIRSPRHLNNLSKYYDDGYKQIVGNKTYRQERDMIYSSYNWQDYTGVSGVSSQEPIGRTSDNAFSATYDGGCYTIGDLSFITESSYYVGMFGYSTGTIKNVVLATQYTKDGNSYRVQRTDAARTNETVYYGILVGKNSGKISNSAVAGYYLSGKDGTVHGYANSTIYLGGLVGYNEGTITDSAADGPKMSLAMHRATCFAGGLIGYNTGSVSNSYALNHISSDVTEGTTIIAGFAAYNSGSLSQTYCATALTSQGTGSYAYAFAPRDGGGSASESYYLYNGSYEFVDGLYAYEGNDAATFGNARKYQQLKDMRGNRVAVRSEYNKLTKELDSSETVYPYRAVVKDSSGNYVHYGEWQVKPSLGVFGVFYWEHEENGQNNGYKITYIGTSYGDVKYRSTLCDSHDDGGEITEYGYGYFVGEDYVNDVTYSLSDIAMSDNNNINTSAKAALESQIPGIKFYPHTTKSSADGDYIYLSGKGSNGLITLTKGSESYTFNISPFFANALSFNTNETSSDAEATKYINTTPGLSENPYEIRSSKQLQFINWNYASKSNSDLVTSSNYTKYNYLLYATVTSAGTQTLDAAGNKVAANYVFEQSHDLNASNITDFSPIAGQGKGTSSSNSSYSATLYAWFGGTYDGQSYKIQELNINSKSYSVGLFGVTVGAEIKNTILYSTHNAVITRETSSTDEAGAYSLGGLIGVAYDYASATNRTITNCAIAGYRIVDNSKNQLTLGEANVGGLIGVSNVNIDKCSAVTNIEINCTHVNSSGQPIMATWGNFIRVGGISGAVQNKITNSYSGGSIVVGDDVLEETYDSNLNKISTTSTSQANVNKSTNIYLSGISGSGFTMNYINFTNSWGVRDGSPNISNCYTYMSFPKMEGTIRSITMFASVADRYAQGTYVTIDNCYYLDSSAEIDTTNLPSYYFGRSSSAKNAMTTDLKNKMILGYSKWMYTIFNNSSSDDNNKIYITTASATKDYRALSNASMIQSLGSSFAFVSTTDESGQSIDGKYSFPAGNSALAGKNYPFPTVITQDSGTTHVHYGEWPFAGAYWENGIDTLDIFGNMDLNDTSSEGPYAYKEFILLANKDEHINENLQISIDGSYAEIVLNDDGSQYRRNADGNYVIKLKALKVGTSTVSATWGESSEYSAEFTMTVTANLDVSANPNQFELKNGAIGQSTLSATSKEDSTKDYSKKVTWSAIPSTKVSAEGDVGVSLSNNICNITSYGLNAQINVKATYNYHGQNYVGLTVIDVLRDSAIGISDSTSYNEAGIKDNTETSQTINGVNVEYSSDNTKPTNASTYFLYEINSNDFIKTNIDSTTVTVTDSEGNEIEGLIIDPIDPNNVTENTNGFRTIPLNIYYYSTDLNDSITGAKVNVTIVNGNNTYVLTLDDVTIRPKAYKLTLNANGGSYEEDKTTQQLDITEDIVLADLENKPTKVGYELSGWYLDEACSEGEEVTEITLANVTSNMELYAKWTPVTTKMKFDRNDGSEDESARVEEKDVSYDSETLPVATREGYTFAGWMNSNNEFITDSNGAILNQEVFNQMVLSTEEITLYAKWTSLNVIFKTQVEDGEDLTLATIGVIEGDTSTGYIPNDIDESYELEGWYLLSDDTQTKVLNADGSIVEGLTVDGYIENGQFITTDNKRITLYAKWIQTKSAYVLKDTLESNNSYLFVTSNTDGSAVAMNSDLTGTDVTIQSDIENKKYIETSESNILWNYNESSTLSINNQYLYGYTSTYYSRNYYIQLSSSSSSWNYTNNMLKTTYSSGRRTYDIYVSYSRSKFNGSDSGSSIYLYSLDDIKIETFSYLNRSVTVEEDIETTTEESIVQEEITETEQTEETYSLVDELVVEDEQVESEESQESEEGIQPSVQSEEEVSE